MEEGTEGSKEKDGTTKKVIKMNIKPMGTSRKILRIEDQEFTKDKQVTIVNGMQISDSIILFVDSTVMFLDFGFNMKIENTTIKNEMPEHLKQELKNWLGI